MMLRVPRRLALTLVVVAAPWALLGCGDGGTNTMPANPPAPATTPSGEPAPPPPAGGAPAPAK